MILPCLPGKVVDPHSIDICSTQHPPVNPHSQVFVICGSRAIRDSDSSTFCANARGTFVIYIRSFGTAVAQWLRCCATNRKVAGSIPADVIGFSLT